MIAAFRRQWSSDGLCIVLGERIGMSSSGCDESMRKGSIMKTPVVSALFLILCLATAIPVSLPRPRESGSTRPIPNTAPTLINTCLITNDVERLAAFYAQVLNMKPRRVDATYVDFPTGTGVLALFAAEAQEKYIPGSAMPGQNHSAILEFKVTDVDQEYARLHDLVKHWVKQPTTQPWGTRSIYFRDPDGNLVDFFAPVASE
jgi:catechol 2,3-dioxygenase-like lactoylglutathione lyase family enzyme